MREFSKFKQSEEFARVYREGRKWHCQGMIIFYLQGPEKKMAVVASKRVGKAVERNRAKRLLRALFSRFENRLESGGYILIAKNDIAIHPFLALEKNLKWGLSKIRCLR